MMLPDEHNPRTPPPSQDDTQSPAGPPLTHFFHCWRFPNHHECAVAMIELQGEENTTLIVRTAVLERALRDHGHPVPDGWWPR